MEGGRHNYYVVRKGRVPGIYTNWVDCERQVSGFKGNEYKGFQVRREAVEWLNSGGDNSGEHDDDRGGGGQPSNDNRGTLSSYFRGLSITSGEKSVFNVGGCSSSFEVVGMYSVYLE
ncbi:ribonuclease H-like [Arachis ipaensis]|uniref:ribonuclease H-like n=1 Tax=Arachis ipaensis TaxID=130454 RepID=UPI0007AF32DA|nr:ribonuclease H-like [Arachis ipaensis]XP_025651975.1 ribonuclease H-like [Arachis hypogaea]